MNAYIRTARPDHWIKNAFILAGFGAALALSPAARSLSIHLLFGRAVVAVVIACLASSNNYIINEIFDARRDQLHPTKRHRPVASGKVRTSRLWALSAAAAFAALLLAYSTMSWRFTLVLGVFLIVGGVFYNVPPIRTKELPYLDVISESVNAPIRLLLGWFALGESGLPPIALLVSYWGFGAFLMAAKRYAEYRYIASPARAAAYRKSFSFFQLAVP